ncbi:MAG: Exopolysaccharide phosphotransferase CpsY [Desulfovibrio sp.]
MEPDTAQTAGSAATGAKGAASFAVDAVFTWVDGADPEWLENKQRLRRKLFGEKGVPDDADNASRFADNDELRYALRSLALYAPWIRKVHLVTAGQKPAWLNTETVTLVNHEAVFPEDVPLPVFSTRPIEFCVHRVPGLAEHFIYSNDDFMLGRPVSPGDFFLPDGTPLLWMVRRGPEYMRKLLGKIGSPSSHASAVARAHKMISDRYDTAYPYVLRHYPKSMTKHSAAALWDAFPQKIRATLNAPFRSPSDVSVTMLYPLYALAEGIGRVRVVNGVSQVVDFIFGKGVAHIGASIGDDNAARKMRAIMRFRPRTFCLNDAPGASGADRAALREFLAAMFPEPSKYELAEHELPKA